MYKKLIYPIFLKFSSLKQYNLFAFIQFIGTEIRENYLENYSCQFLSIYIRINYEYHS